MASCKPLYCTRLGKAYCSDSLAILRDMPSNSVDLVLTSPPYALHFKKEYGNASQEQYWTWLQPFAFEIRRVLKKDGSFVLNLGGAWTAGAPVRSLYHYRVLLSLCDELGFHLCQEFFWFNPAKLPAPAEWVNVRRIRVKDSVEYVFWLSMSPFPRASNAKVLQPYSEDMLRLIRRGTKARIRPSGHSITTKFSRDRGGSIPPNLITCGNNESNSVYIKKSKKLRRKIHPARFPAEIPRFFIEFLTDPGGLVVDPFAGSNTTGTVAEALRRKWISIEIDKAYAIDSRLRFQEPLVLDRAQKDKSGLLLFDV